jgi:hypothetical protein
VTSQVLPVGEERYRTGRGNTGESEEAVKRVERYMREWRGRACSLESEKRRRIWE